MSPQNTALPTTCDHLPQAFKERMGRLYPDRALAEMCGERSESSLRANTLKISPEELRALLASEGFQLHTVPWYPAAFTFKTEQQRALTELSAFAEGLFYIQNLSSMIPALVLDPQPGERVLDLTAAPGSKTTQLATLMKNTGEIVANDLSRERIFRLQTNLKQQGVVIAKTSIGPGELLWHTYPEQFDRVLVDAPCTMEGRITCGDSKTYDDWSLKKIKKLSRRQQFLLRSAVSSAKPGGVIVYSTCTMAPEENEAVIQWLLDKEGAAVSLESIFLPNLPLSPGRAKWEDTAFGASIALTARIDPQPHFEGFFVAKLRKIRSTIGY